MSVGRLLMWDGKIRHWLIPWRPIPMSYLQTPVPLWFKLWLKLPCWLVHDAIMLDPLRDPGLMWCTKCDHRWMR